jgi:hypothetical protein
LNKEIGKLDFCKQMFSRLFILIVLALGTACGSGKIDCPKPETVRLKKKAGVNYKVLLARQRQQPKQMTRAELKQLMSREVKTVTVEEWDCPRPGVKNVPKQVQENIRKNKKRFDSYYKKRNSSDSLQFESPNQER